MWYKNGIPHRNNNLPAIIYNDGKCEWYINGSQQKEGEIDAFHVKG